MFAEHIIGFTTLMDLWPKEGGSYSHAADESKGATPPL